MRIGVRNSQGRLGPFSSALGDREAFCGMRLRILWCTDTEMVSRSVSGSSMRSFPSWLDGSKSRKNAFCGAISLPAESSMARMRILLLRSSRRSPHPALGLLLKIGHSSVGKADGAFFALIEERISLCRDGTADFLLEVLKTSRGGTQSPSGVVVVAVACINIKCARAEIADRYLVTHTLLFA